MAKVVARPESTPAAPPFLAGEQESENRDRGSEAGRADGAENERLGCVHGDGHRQAWRRRVGECHTRALPLEVERRLGDVHRPPLGSGFGIEQSQRLGRRRSRPGRDREERVLVERRQEPKRMLAQLRADEHELG